MTKLIHAPHLKPNGTIPSAVATGGINGYARSKKATAVYKKGVHKEAFLRL